MVTQLCINYEQIFLKKLRMEFYPVLGMGRAKGQDTDRKRSHSVTEVVLSTCAESRV